MLLINYIIMRSLFPGPDSPVKVPYTTFREEVERGNASAIYSRGTNIEGRFVKPVTWPPPEQKDSKSRLPRQPHVRQQPATSGGEPKREHISARAGAERSQSNGTEKLDCPHSS